MADDNEQVDPQVEPTDGEAKNEDGTWTTVGGEETAEAQEKPSEEDPSKAFFQAKYQEQKKEFDAVLGFLEDNGIDRPTLSGWMDDDATPAAPATDTPSEADAPLTEQRLVQLLNQRDQHQAEAAQKQAITQDRRVAEQAIQKINTAFGYAPEGNAMLDPVVVQELAQRGVTPQASWPTTYAKHYAAEMRLQAFARGQTDASNTVAVTAAAKVEAAAGVSQPAGAAGQPAPEKTKQEKLLDAMRGAGSSEASGEVFG